MNGSFGAAFPLLLLVLLVGMFALQQRARNRMAMRTQQLQDSLTVGTEVMTTSGLYGTIAALDEQTVDLEVAPDVVVRWARAAIAEVKGTEPTAEPPATEPAEE